MEFDYRLALMAGLDIPIPECQLVVHQPRVKEIGMMGENEFNVGAQILCIDKESFKEGIDNIPSDFNNFNLLMSFMNEKEAADKKQTVKSILALVLPQYQIILTPRSIICNGDNENLIIDEGNFDNFQKILKKIFCFGKKKDKEGEVPETYNPANEAARKIAEKLYKGRKQIAEIRTNANPDDSALSRYISILAVGLGYSIEQLNNLTLFQINDLFERFTLKMKQDMDISIRLAGGKPDEQPSHWMGPLH